jgi:predicted aspartyl protease
MKKLIFAAAMLASASFVFWGTAGLSETIPMISDGGTFRVPVTINGQLTLNFVIDSGAADVSVPTDVVMTLLRTGTITDADFLGKQTYRLADGSTVPSQQFVIRSLKVGDKTLENVVGSRDRRMTGMAFG